MRNSGLLLLALGTAILGASPALAMDPVCQQLLDTQANASKVPFHLYMTSEDKFANPAMTRAGAQLHMTGVKKSEEISTVKTLYVEHDGKWMDMKMSFADMSKTDPNDPDVKKSREAERCKAAGDDMVNGQPAAVYQTTNAETGVNSKIWISKVSHLPLKSEMTTDAGQMKSFTTSTFDYKNVQAPAGAMSMQDFMKAQHH